MAKAREAGMQEGSQVSGSELGGKIPFHEAGGKVLSIIGKVWVRGFHGREMWGPVGRWMLGLEFKTTA